MRTVFVTVTIRATIEMDEDIEVEEVLNEMDYLLQSDTKGAVFTNMEVADWDVVDSK